MTITHFSNLELHSHLLQAIEKKGWQYPTAIQQAVIPAALEGKDILGSSPTGTGKTAAFLLPVLQYLLDHNKKKHLTPRVLILTPTRELAIQVAQQAQELAQYTTLNITTITGGVAYMNHSDAFTQKQDIVVATTGRLLQYIHEGIFDCYAIEVLILDEADRMLDMGFANDIQQIAEKILSRKQTLLFSATLEGKAIEDFAANLLHQPQRCEVVPSRKEKKKTLQFYYHVDDLKHKNALLHYVLTRPEVTKSIVFVRKRERVYELSSYLHSLGIAHAYLEGELPQTKRNEALKRLNDGRVNVLIATDVAARGLDLSDISHVINYDLPRSTDVYLHRIGRTGRAGRKGIALSLVEAHDHPLLEKIGRYLQEPLKKRVVDTLRPHTKPPSSNLRKKSSKKALAKKQQEKQEKRKIKVRERDKKNKGKRRQPTSVISDTEK